MFYQTSYMMKTWFIVGIVSLKQPEKDGSTSLAVIVGPATGLVVVIVTLVVFIAILRFTYVFKSYSRLWVIISDTALMLTWDMFVRCLSVSTCLSVCKLFTFSTSSPEPMDLFFANLIKALLGEGNSR